MGRMRAECRGAVLPHRLGGQCAAPFPDEPPIDAWITSMPISTANAAADWLFARFWKRYPGLKMALSEGGIGWIPYFLERADFTLRAAWRLDTHHVRQGKAQRRVQKAFRHLLHRRRIRIAQPAGHRDRHHLLGSGLPSLGRHLAEVARESVEGHPLASFGRHRQDHSPQRHDGVQLRSHRALRPGKLHRGRVAREGAACRYLTDVSGRPEPRELLGATGDVRGHQEDPWVPWGARSGSPTSVIDRRLKARR